MTLIATLPPYVRHRDAIASHPLVDALRFNTIMPIGEPKREVLATLQRACAGKPLFVDLKGRQLRVVKFAYLPYAFVEISRRIRVDLPARILFKDGEAEIVRIVDGNQLILADRPARVVGAGEPVTILDRSLVVEGYLTDDDCEYIAAARALGLHDYLLSFAEQDADLEAVRVLDPEARIVVKIESKRGLDFVREQPGVRLMAARDDLFIQMGAEKSAILDALDLIVRTDPDAIVASRILTSLEVAETVALGDLADLALMHRLGYRTVMLSDGLCFGERAFERAIRVYAEMAAWLQR